MSLLELQGFGKRFAGRDGGDGEWVIRDFSLAVEEGEFVTLIGPSGSGKSTLLNAIAQVDAPSAGRILLDGEVIAEAGMRTLNPGWHRRIGYVTQDDNLLPWRTLIDNVLFPFALQKRLDADAQRQAAALMEAVGLTGFERHYPHELSGGMRKRAALIRTLVYDPPVILMDEPFGALDAQTRVQLQSDLLDLWQARRKTIIFVTHDIGEAIALGDRAVVLSKRPTRVLGEHRIAIPRPRHIHDVFAMPDFSRYYDAIRSQVT